MVPRFHVVEVRLGVHRSPFTVRRSPFTVQRAQISDHPPDAKFNPDSEIRTTDSTDSTDFAEVIGDERTNLFVAKLQGVANRNLLYRCYNRVKIWFFCEDFPRIASLP